MRRFIFKKRHGSRGLSLVELLLVMAILSVVMMAVMSLYIPAHQSTVVQSQVSDVQSNLRLALKTMTRDLLLAGFLVPNFPVVFPDASPDYYAPDNRGTTNAADFIIRTRTVGNDFARVSAVTAITGGYRLTVTNEDMVNKFPKDSRVRLFEPISANEVTEDPAVVNDDDRAYTVEDTGPGWIEIVTSANASLEAADILAETVVLRVKDENQPPLQTIRYRLNNGALERIVNDTTQILARNLDAVNFAYSFTPEGRVNHVDINLTGVTRALKNDAIAGEKTRSVDTSVKLRNVY